MKLSFRNYLEVNHDEVHVSPCAWWLIHRISVRKRDSLYEKEISLRKHPWEVNRCWLRGLLQQWCGLCDGLAAKTSWSWTWIHWRFWFGHYQGQCHHRWVAERFLPVHVQNKPVITEELWRCCSSVHIRMGNEGHETNRLRRPLWGASGASNLHTANGEHAASKNRQKNDVRDAVRSIETTSGHQITVSAFNREEYTIREIQGNLDQILKVEITLRDVAADYVAELDRRFLNHGMDFSLGVISTAPLQQHGQKLYCMFEDGIEVIVPYGRLLIVDGRHRRSFIRKIKGEYPDRNEPHAWEQSRMTVENFTARTRFLEDS